MKKSLLATAALAAIFASCSQDETIGVNQGKGITFNAYTNNVTRAVETTEKNMGSFKVHALSTDESVGFIDVVSSSDQGTTWTSTNIHYWPGDENLEMHFYGYSPSELSTAFKSAPTVEIDANNIQTGNSIKGIKPNIHADKQADLVVSYKKGTKKQNEATGVEMNFKHAFAQVVIKAKNSNPSMKVEVVGVKVAGANGTGDLSLPTDTESATENAFDNKWTGLKDMSSYMAGGKKASDAFELTSELKDIMFKENGFMLIPQQLTAWNESSDKSGAYISVLCRISQNVNGSTDTPEWKQRFPETTGSFGFAAVPINTKWEAGKKYTYNLEFFSKNGGGGGVTDPDPTDPEPPTDPEKPTIDPDEPGGEPVVGGPIKFDVTVDEWKEGSGAGDTPMGPSSDDEDE